MKTTENSPSKVLNIALWATQIILAAMFLMAGFMKSTSPIGKLHETMPWSNDVPDALVRFIGISEFLGAVGLLLPAILKIKPILTPIAAIGLALIMLFATVFHIARGESEVITVNISIMLIALFIAWGRMKRIPIVPKNKKEQT